MKKTLNSIVLFLLLFIGQNAWGKTTTLGSGKLGSNITWKLVLDSSTGLGTLSINGTGFISDYSSGSAAPWARISDSSSSSTIDRRNFVNIIEIGEGITTIGQHIFEGTNVVSLNIPSSCKTIGNYAFAGCTYLREIYIPESLTAISPIAFNNCSNLALVHYDGRCTSNTVLTLSGVASTGKIIEKTGDGTSNVNVPAGWEYYTHGVKCQGGAWVAENAAQAKLFFYAKESGAKVNYAYTSTLSEGSADSESFHPWRVNCYKYTSLEIGKNIASIDKNEFLGYSSNGDVTKMGYVNMQSITVQSGNSKFVVGVDGALYDNAKTTVYLYPAKNTATKIEVPATVTEIRPGAFYGAKNLQEVDFLGTINTFGQYAFAQAGSLNFIYFATETAPTDYPVSMMDGKTSVFKGVASTGVITANAETDAFKLLAKRIEGNWASYAVGTYISNGTLYVMEKGEYNIKSSDASWYSNSYSIKRIVIGECVTNIGFSAFEGCSNVTEVTLHNRGYINVDAFKGCYSLTRVNIGPGVTKFCYEYSDGSWGDWGLPVGHHSPFNDCYYLSEINVEDLASYCSIKGIEYLTDKYYSFSGSKKDKTLYVNGVEHSYKSELIIPEGVKEIPNAAFRYFTNVLKIKFPSTMTEIPHDNFAYHDNLREVTIPETVTDIGSNAFCECVGLRTVTLNNNGDIDDEAFKNCTSLKTVTLNHKGIMYKRVFEGCTALTRINIGKDERDLGGNSFEDCSNLSEVNVEDIGSYCSIMYGLGKLPSGLTLMIKGVAHDSSSELEIPEGTTKISSGAFCAYANVTKIRIPSTVTSVGNHAFSNSNINSIVCVAPICPATTDKVAESPESITLKVRHGLTPLYKASSGWRGFKMEEFKYDVADLEVFVNEDVSPGMHEVANLSYDEKVLSWSSTDTNIATVNKNGNYGAKVLTESFVYDGTTKVPYKMVTIKGDLGGYDSCAWNVKIHPQEVTLRDGNAYKLIEDYEAKKVSYTRSFSKAGAWQPIYMPFAIDVEAYKSEFDIAEIYAMCPTKDTNGNGVIDSDDDKVIIVTALNEGYTIPNAPYLLKPKTAKEYTIEANNSVLKAAEINVLEFSTAKYQYQVSGIYDADFYVEPGDNNFYMTSGGGFSFAKTKKANIKPNRWVLHEEAKGYYGSSASNSDSKMSNFTIEVLGEDIDETTAIKLINGETISVDSKNNSAYNLNGMKVDATKSLPSGIYIINGKKVFKK